MSHSFTLESSTLNIILFRLLHTGKTKHGTTNIFALSTLYKRMPCPVRYMGIKYTYWNVYIDCLKYRNFYKLGIMYMWVLIRTNIRVISAYVIQLPYFLILKSIIQSGAGKTGPPSRRPTPTLVYETVGRFFVHHPV